MVDAERVHVDSFGFDQHGDEPFYARLCELVEHAAEKTAADGQQLAGELGLDVQVRVERNHSTVSQTILKVADELDSDMILVGTHGTTALQPGLLGSVSNGLLHQSQRPVLVVPILDPAAEAALSEVAAARRCVTPRDFSSRLKPDRLPVPTNQQARGSQ